MGVLDCETWLFIVEARNLFPVLGVNWNSIDMLLFYFITPRVIHEITRRVVILIHVRGSSALKKVTPNIVLITLIL